MEPVFVIRRRGTYGPTFWRRTEGRRALSPSWVASPDSATHFDTEEEAAVVLADISLRSAEVVPYRQPLAQQQAGLPASDFIQEWPENKLTVKELQAVVALLDGRPRKVVDIERAKVKLRAAFDKAKEGAR